MPGPTVLVVDDERSHRELLAGFLATRGFRVHEAADGQEAVDRAREGDIDVVLLDQRMPRLDGLAAIHGLREIDSRMVIVVMTAYGSEESAAAALAAGAVAYLRKPLDLERLEGSLAELVAARRGEGG